MFWDVVLPVVGGGLPGAVPAQQLVVRRQLVTRPNLFPEENKVENRNNKQKRSPKVSVFRPQKIALLVAKSEF